MPDQKQPITRADLDNLVRGIIDTLSQRFTEHLRETEQRLTGLLGQIEERTAEGLRENEQRFTERIHDTETKLLSAFYTYQEHERIQFRKLQVDAGNSAKAAELRLDNLEQRIFQIEKRLDLGREKSQ